MKIFVHKWVVARRREREEEGEEGDNDGGRLREKIQNKRKRNN